jgi:hypothetical protein
MNCHRHSLLTMGWLTVVPAALHLADPAPRGRWSRETRWIKLGPQRLVVAGRPFRFAGQGTSSGGQDVPACLPAQECSYRVLDLPGIKINGASHRAAVIKGCSAASAL